jgi:hypothetical protein
MPPLEVRVQGYIASCAGTCTQAGTEWTFQLRVLQQLHQITLYPHAFVLLKRIEVVPLA